MTPFNPIIDPELPAQHSPLLRAALLTIGYIEANGPIGLTASRGLKRYFVEWAAEAFDWRWYSASDLYAVNKVLNESDFPPLVILHDLLVRAKLVRHRQGALHLTRLAGQLKNDPASLWTLLASRLLFDTDHSKYTRYGDHLLGNWDIFLNVINVEVQNGVSEETLCSVLFGSDEQETPHGYPRQRAALYIHVLRPLCWAGLLEEVRTGEGFARQEHFFKTPLWHAALSLETDRHLESVTRH